MKKALQFLTQIHTINNPPQNVKRDGKGKMDHGFFRLFGIKSALPFNFTKR
jgi:hypothetical protein